MFDDVLKSLMLWVLGGALLIITLTYVISNTVMLGIDAHTTASSVDKYETYIITNNKP